MSRIFPIFSVFLATNISPPSSRPATDHLLPPSPSTPPTTAYLHRRNPKQKQAKNRGGDEKSEGPTALQPTTACRR